jgi:hypothetical protein
MAALSIDIRALPHGLQPIVKHLGVEKALEVLAEHQGQVFYIPDVPTLCNEVVKVFGLALVKEWSEKYPFCSYQIPMASKVLIQIRNQEICAVLDAKTSHIQALVKRFGITRQQITNIYNDHKQTSNQQQLGMF